MTNATDIKVRGSFTGLIADFLQSLYQLEDDNPQRPSLFAKKSAKGNGTASASFIKIGSNAAEMQDDFRYIMRYTYA